MSIIIDRYSKPIKIGDDVCVIKGKCVYCGKVSHFTPSGVTIVDLNNNKINIQSRFQICVLQPIMANVKIVVAEKTNIQSVFVNDELVFKGHSINWYKVLQKLGCNITEHFV